ncbi:MAG TPA: SDR family oxidoreductase [Nitrospiria bacterium]|nr:SDR family oxidoreductase [Nitrospiria bacterium]
MFSLCGKVALITGGANDIGSAIAKRLSENGAMVAINYLKSEGQAKETLEKIVESGGEGMILKGDVRRRRDLLAMFDEILKRYGKIDILINNAHNVIRRAPIYDDSWSNYKGQIEVVIKGGLCASQIAVKDMTKRQWGRIINILSTMIDGPVSGYGSYISALSAMEGITKVLAHEVGEFGITANMILPGFTLGKVTPHAPRNIQKEIAGRTPLRRLALPSDIADAVLYLASPESSFITGAKIVVDGGLVMH